MAGKVERFAKFGALAARVGGSYLGQRLGGMLQDDEARRASLRRAHLDNAERIAAELGALKGAAMKVGQAVAQAADGIELPREAREILGRLHDRAEPVPFAVVRERVEAELGGGVDSLFRSFDPEPLGTASLGQAHAAVLPGGEEVVVKVLHPGVEDNVQSDLANFRRVLVGGRVLRRPKEELDAIFVEIEARLQEEVDYRQEAAHLVEFRRRFSDHADVTIPRVYEGWSTQRVLTMERLRGQPLSVFAVAGNAAAKQRAGRTLAGLFMTMLYRDRAIHADPHPGNYLFAPDGCVGVLDFGCVRHFDLGWVHRYGTCAHRTRHGDREGLLRAAVATAFMVERLPESDELLWQFCRAIGLPFRGGDYTVGVPEDRAAEEIKKLVPRVIVDPNLRAPHELTFLHRALGGTYQLCRQLKTRADFGKIFEDAFATCTRDAVAAGVAFQG
jgi:predicted unusual protein kinase regulating ubiquinone biosynthesis (AarF/ABC1/UbiB family)